MNKEHECAVCRGAKAVIAGEAELPNQHGIDGEILVRYVAWSHGTKRHQKQK